MTPRSLTRRPLTRHPVIVVVALFGWATMGLVYLPALAHLMPVRIVIGDAVDAPPCAWRVSTAGVIHGPDSPYRAMVPASRCYPTREAAEAALQER